MKTPAKLNFDSIRKHPTIMKIRNGLNADKICDIMSREECKSKIMSGSRSTVSILKGTDFVVRVAERGNKLVAADSFSRSFDVLSDIGVNTGHYSDEMKVYSRVNVPLMVGETEMGIPFTLNNYVEGVHLNNVYMNMDLIDRSRVLYGVMKAIEILHQKKLSHNDIHMGNIMVNYTKSGSIVVTLIDMDSVEYHGHEMRDYIETRTISSQQFDIYKMSDIFVSLLYEHNYLHMNQNGHFNPISSNDVKSMSIKQIKHKFIDNYFQFIDQGICHKLNCRRNKKRKASSL